MLLISLLYTAEGPGVWLRFTHPRLPGIYTQVATATHLLHAGVLCAWGVSGGLERVAEMCKRTSLGEVIAAGVATVESRRSSSRKF